GGAATLAASSVVQQSEFVVAIDAEERRDKGRLVRIASEIKPEWLIELFADQLIEKTDALWKAQSERVEVVDRLMYDQLVVSERRAREVNGEEASRVLAEAALAVGLQRFIELELIAKFIARVEFVGRTFPEFQLPAIAEEDVRMALMTLCDGLQS